MRILKKKRKTHYRGREFSSAEVEVLNKLEHLLGRKIPTIYEINIERPIETEWFDMFHRRGTQKHPCFGITTEENQVTGLALDGILEKGFGIKTLQQAQKFARTPGYLRTQEIFRPPFPDYLANLSGLRVLSLRSSGLTEIPPFVYRLAKLQVLDLSDNPLISLPESIGQLTSLVKLKLQATELRSVPNSFMNLKQLETLDLSRNELNDLPESFGSLYRLQTLDLSQNALTVLPETFKRLVNLSSLNLEKNKLEYLPKSFEQLQNIRSLNLRENPLSQLTLRNMIALFRLSENKVKVDGYLGVGLEHQEWIVPLSELQDWIRYAHPLIKPLNLQTISLTDKIICPLCGALELLTGQAEQAGQEYYICYQCENIIQ